MWWTQPVEALAVDGEFAYAPWWRRILSAILDSFVISLLSTPFAGAAVSRLVEALAEGGEVSGADLRTVTLTNLFVTVVYMTALHAWRGATIGKMALSTVLVRDDGRSVSFATAFVRAVTVAGTQFVSSWLLIPIFVDELWLFGNRRRQTLHDVVAKTIVVRAASTREVTRQ